MAKYNPPDNNSSSQAQQAQGPAQSAAIGNNEAINNLAEAIRRLGQQGGLQFSFQGAPPTRIDTALLLSQKPRVTVAFPPCSEELLGLIKSTDTDEITGLFKEYFKFARHRTFGQQLRNGTLEELDQQLTGEIDDVLLGGCQTGGAIYSTTGAPNWPSDCCICTPCVTLDGNRNPSPIPPPAGGTPTTIKRLFIGDALWLFYFERMGLNQILGAILDAFASTGRLPISNGSLSVGVRDDIVALVLEIMVRQTKTGMSSTVRDRAGLYRTTLGWVSDGGRKLNVDSEINTGFNTLFHKFIYHALEFYRDKRLAIAIQGAAGGVARPSAATLVTISETLELLTKRFEPFSYGRNYYNTLSGIVWAIASLSVLRALAPTLGIPPALTDIHELVPAAYDLLVLKRPVTSGDANRFIVHRECARNGRDILLDLEVINHLDAIPGGQLEDWLTQVEAKVEAYRTSYRSMTGVDIGASANPTIAQQA
jgi:hypothetical protein